MELRDLRSFMAVAEELSFTRAALRLKIAQPPLSQRIQQFEREVGTPLFARTKRRVALTDAGRTLLPLARQILNASDAALHAVRMVGTGHGGKVTLGAFYSAIYTVLPEIIRPFAAEYPEVDIQIREMVVTQQLKALRDGSIDIGVVRLAHVPPDLKVLDLVEETLMVALHVDHPLAGKAAIPLRALVAEPLITLDPDVNSEFHLATRAAFDRHGLAPTIARQAIDMHLVLGLVSAGLGVALVPSSLAKITHKYIVFRRIKEPTAPMTIRLAWLSDAVAPLVPRFVDAARKTFYRDSKALARGSTLANSSRE